MVNATIKGWQEQTVFTLKSVVEKKKWPGTIPWATLQLAVGGASGKFWENFAGIKFNDLLLQSNGATEAISRVFISFEKVGYIDNT